ncbi:hypothetical protein PR202_ga19893 [Eleusine coracana subsp. coracana]|uniref:F-box domain-containing protein n=1 Tax=Eleusine coracana subsp. coracana TaxID=191504 RepID=A0AAV5CWH7_ELECO|nr:hypothetical protein PR202_ga19893 [Eleusine coracana subsp. coracana]
MYQRRSRGLDSTYACAAAKHQRARWGGEIARGQLRCRPLRRNAEGVQRQLDAEAVASTLGYKLASIARKLEPIRPPMLSVPPPPPGRLSPRGCAAAVAERRRCRACVGVGATSVLATVPRVVLTESAEQADRLSALPDDVLVLILDNLLLLRDAVRTSILSRRWRHLPGLLSEIVLDVGDFEFEEDDGSKYTLEKLMQTNATVVEATKSILAHKSQRAITYLSVTFYLRDESIDIMRAMDGAMANREVVAAELDFLPEMLDKYCGDDNMLANGRRFMTFIDAYPRAFAGLTYLHVQSMRLGESDIPNVLRTYSRDHYPLYLYYVPKLWVLHLSNPGTTLHKTLNLRELLSNGVIGELALNFLCERIWIQPERQKLLAPLLRNLQIWSHKCYASEEDEREELWRSAIFRKSK